MTGILMKYVLCDSFIDKIPNVLNIKLVESDKTTSIYNVSTRVLSKK